MVTEEEEGAVEMTTVAATGTGGGEILIREVFGRSSLYQLRCSLVSFRKLSGAFASFLQFNSGD